MISKILPIAFFLCTASGAATAASLSFLGALTGDRLSELQTEEGDACFFGDPDCYPADFTPTDAIQSDLAPFAGLPVGTELPFSFDLLPYSEADCQIGDLFDCQFEAGFNQRKDDAGQTVWLEFFDFVGDYNIQLDLVAETVRFVGAAGSFFPGGCTPEEGIARGLPDGYCDFFGYEADFEITSEITGNIGGHVAAVPLNASMVFAFFGVTALFGLRGLKRG